MGGWGRQDYGDFIKKMEMELAFYGKAREFRYMKEMDNFSKLRRE